MSRVIARPFTDEPGFTSDFALVRDFLVRVNQDAVRTPGFLWARWEWAFCLPFQDATALARIGIWEDGGVVVGLVTYETTLGEAWVVADPAHRALLPAMVEHAVTHLSHEGRLRLLVPDDDAALRAAAGGHGLGPTPDGEPNAVLRLVPGTDGAADAATGRTSLPPGYEVRSLADVHDLRRLDRLLHRGFDHPGEPPGTPEDLAWRARSISSPSTVRELNAVVVAPGGEYAAYCGVWHEPRTSYAMVEPVCTDPDHRRRGCASAAVRAALARCAARGATHAYVGSDLPLYTALGFVPTVHGTWWVTA